MLNTADRTDSSARHIIFLRNSRTFLEPVAESLEGIGVTVSFVSVDAIKANNAEAHRRRYEPAPHVTSFDEWRAIAPQLLQTLDRSVFKPMSGKELLGYFNWLVSLANDLVATLPENSVIIFEHAPHHPWSVAFAHAAEASGKQVLALEYTLIPTRVVVRRALATADATYLGPHGDIPMNSRAAHAVLISEFHKWSQKWHREPKGMKEATNDWLAWATTLLLHVRRGALPSRARQRFAPKPYRINSPMTTAVAMVRAVRGARSSRRYLSRVGEKDAHIRHAHQYAYLPLHKQPELTTEPACGDFADQLTFISQVRKSLDAAGFENIRILAREHPKQLRQPASVITHSSRRRDFYDSIRAIPNTALVHPSVSPDDLLAGSRLIATANGSTAWEGLILGKPSIMARRTWYADCFGIASLSDRESVTERINLILSLDEDAVIASLNEFLRNESITFPAPAREPLSDTEAKNLAGLMALELVRRVFPGKPVSLDAVSN